MEGGKADFSTSGTVGAFHIPASRRDTRHLLALETLALQLATKPCLDGLRGASTHGVGV